MRYKREYSNNLYKKQRYFKKVVPYDPLYYNTICHTEHTQNIIFIFYYWNNKKQKDLQPRYKSGQQINFAIAVGYEMHVSLAGTTIFTL